MSTDNKEYEIKNVTPQERAQLSQIFIYNEYFRFGPKGYVGHEGIKDSIIRIRNMELRSTDVIVVAQPRSGTTWSQELIWMLANDLNYEKSMSTKMTEKFCFLESSSLVTPRVKQILLEKNRNDQTKLDLLENISKPVQDYLQKTTSRRFLKTHIPISLLPPATLETVKMVYLARDPRDVAVSQYHLYKLARMIQECGFKTFWNAFMKDLIIYTPYFEHLKEAWELRHHPNMLFLFYEDLSKDLAGAIQRMADFFDKKITDSEIIRLSGHLSIQNFKRTESFSPDIYEEIGLLTSSKQFIREGRVGGWRDYFDSDMAQQAEQWINNNLRDTSLRFPVVENK